MKCLLTDFSYMLDENLNSTFDSKLEYDWMFCRADMPVMAVETGLKIPTKSSIGDTVYLDTKIQYKDEFYYTKEKFLKKVDNTKINQDLLRLVKDLYAEGYCGGITDETSYDVWALVIKDVADGVEYDDIDELFINYYCGLRSK